MGAWQEVGDGVFVMRYEFFDQDIGAVVGGGEVLVIDTRTTYAQARELLEDLRRLTPHPWTVLNTHHHFDHAFGNAVFRPADFWGHERCAAELRAHGDLAKRLIGQEMPELAEELAEVEIVPPNRTVGDAGRIVVGGRIVELRHLGRGHTDNDLVAIVPDASVLFLGDLIEVGAPPSFGDSFPLDWPETNARVAELFDESAAVVPGHGSVTDREFVLRQTADLAVAAAIAREAHAGGEAIESAIERVPFPEPFARACLERAYAQLDGAI